MKRRKLFPAVLLFVLTVAIVAPNVHAQSTKFLRLSYPRTVEYQSPQPAVVELTVSYQDAKAGYLLVLSVFDDDSQEYLKGTAMGSPDPCHLTTTQTANTSCAVQLRATSGQEHATFQFSTTENPHGLGIWRLLAESGLEYPDGRIISGSFFRHEFSISVVQLVEIQTTSELPKTEALGPFGGNLSLIVGAVMIVVIAAITVAYLTRRRKHGT